MDSELILLPAGLSGFLAVAGFLLLAHAHNRRWYIHYLLKRGIRTEGTVVELRRDPGPLFGNKEGEGFAPVVEYTTQSGNVLKHFSTTYRVVSPYKPGAVVPIWYINYRSKREAALEDDLPGTLPRKLFIAGAIALTAALPRVISGMSGLF